MKETYIVTVEKATPDFIETLAQKECEEVGKSFVEKKQMSLSKKYSIMDVSAFAAPVFGYVIIFLLARLLLNATSAGLFLSFLSVGTAIFFSGPYHLCAVTLSKKMETKILQLPVMSFTISVILSFVCLKFLFGFIG